MADGPRSPAPRGGLPRQRSQVASTPRGSTRPCSRATCSLRTCRTPISSSAPAANSGSATSCCGRRPIRNSCSSTRSGRISPSRISSAPSASFTAASGAMAQSLDASKSDALRLRILSASVLAPLAIVAAWLGGALLAAVTLVGAGLMGWEWGRLTDRGQFGGRGVLVAATVVAGVGAAILGAPMLALGVVLAGGVARVAWPGPERNANLWAGIGTLWIGAACVGLLWLAADPGAGRATILWLFAVVWATDSVAYLVGRWAG